MEFKDMLKEILPKDKFNTDIIDATVTENWVIIVSNTGSKWVPINQRTLNLYEVVNYCHLYARDRGYKIITEQRSYGVEWIVISSEESIFDKEYTKLCGYWDDNLVDSVLEATRQIIKGF